MSDLFFRRVDFADAYGECRAEFYLGFLVAFYWAVFFWLRGFAAGFGFFFSSLSKRLKISNLG